jgi:predicted DNA binding CopG/RHH family protein
MAKKVAFSKPKQPNPSPANADAWVNEANGTMKRLTIDVPATLHTRVKMQCAARGLKMADEIRSLLEERFPPS